jgi:hypothetical protein
MAYVQMTQDERVNAIIAFESGEADVQDQLRLFSNLVGTGLAWSLQGTYGRQATALIDAGLIDRQGNISQQAIEEYFEGVCPA